MNKIKKNKQSIGKHVPCFWDDDDYGGDGDDIAAVAEILIQLPDLILHAQSSSSLVWGAKRRRSAISSAAGTKNVAAATSPATPLMFSPSESDDKANNNNNTPSRVSSISKRKLQNREELIQSVTDLTHQKQSLVKEMEAAKLHLDVLRASNLELKHRKQIIYGFSQHSLQTLQQQQQIHYPFQMHHPSIQWSTLSSSVSAVNKMGPVGLPDLNLTLEEAASNVDVLLGLEGGVGGYQVSDASATMVMDYNVNNRALASAQARKRRMQIFKEKNKNQVLKQR